MAKQALKARIGLAGEFGVASELLKLGCDATVTFGNAKATDVIVYDSQKPHLCQRIEVKTSKRKRFVTGFFQKYGDKTKPHPDYWVIVYIDENNISHYYVLTHDEMGKVQMDRNGLTTWQPVEGVDNVTLNNIKPFENQWSKIIF
jgi:hypothetical protein